MRTCAVARSPTDLQAIIECDTRADLIELRLDCFDSFTIEQVEQWIHKVVRDVILVLRPEREGGRYKGSEEERLKILKELSKLRPAYIDLEWDVPEIALDVPTIRSYHNFEGLECPGITSSAQLKKYALTANTPLDALHILYMQKQNPNAIYVGMGEWGALTREFAEMVSAPMTYLSAPGKPCPIPGQIALDQFRSLESLYGLIGSPVTQSVSHITHNALFKELHLLARYVKFDVPLNQLTDFLIKSKAIGIKGFSVTMPHKQSVAQQLYSTTHPIVNTLTLTPEGYIGSNTDVIGALDSIEKCLSLKDKRLFIIGAGGAAKAVAQGAMQRGATVKLFSRKRTGPNIYPLEEFSNHVTGGYDILINATPSHMPIDTSDIIPQTVVMDMTTQPSETELLLYAKAKGCTCIYGLEMFRRQAVMQFLKWLPEEKKESVDAILSKEIAKCFNL